MGVKRDYHLSEKAYESKGHWLTRFVDSEPECLEIILSAKSKQKAIAEVQELNRKKAAGERSILPTTRVIEAMGFQIPVMWSLCGECYAGTVINGETSQDFWAETWEGFQHIAVEAILQTMHVFEESNKSLEEQPEEEQVEEQTLGKAGAEGEI